MCGSTTSPPPVRVFLQGSWTCPWFFLITTLLLLAQMTSMVGSQRFTTAALRTTVGYRTTVYTGLALPATPAHLPRTPGLRVPTADYPANTAYTTTTKRPEVFTTASKVVGNLTGDNICPRSVIQNRYVWKQLTFDCSREEYVYCWDCTGCPTFNSTHCLRQIKGQCKADVYQYEPVQVEVQECCHGYEVLGTRCIESVECKVNNGGCPHICRSNKEAGRHCECYMGFQLIGQACMDFNECDVQKGGCSDKCVNNVGSFYCTCDPGRQLKSPLTCEDVDACKELNGGCDHECKTRDGAHYCVCREGFQLEEGRECRDIDECSNSRGHPCQHKCENRIGSFICRCPEGEFLLPDNKTCSGSGTTKDGGPQSDSLQDSGILKNPTFIGTTAAVGSLLIIVICIWVVCCCVKGCYCYNEHDKRKKRRRRRKKRAEDVEGIVVHYKNGESKEAGFSNPTYPHYVDSGTTEYNTQARTPNGMMAKEEVSGDIHIIPDFD